MTIVKLGDVAREYKEICRSQKDRLPIVGLEHLIPGEITLTMWDQEIENTFTKVFRKGHVLFGRRRAYLKKAAVAPFDGICSGDITVIEAIEEKLLPKLLPFVIQNDRVFNFAISKSAGSLSPRVKWEHLKEYEFNLPSKESQEYLSKLLEVANETKEAYKKLLSLTEHLVKSQFNEMFGAENEYPKTIIGRVVCNKIERVAKVFSDEDTIKYIDISSIDNTSQKVTGYTEFIRRNAPSRAQYILKQGDILVSTVRPNLRNLAINPYDDSNIVGSTGFCVLRSDKINPYYIWGVVTSDEFTNAMVSRASGANYPAVTDKEVLTYEIPLPPIEEQERFSYFVQQSDNSKFELQKAIINIENIIKSLVNQYLN